MASIAFGAKVVAGDVYHEGISGITARRHRRGQAPRLRRQAARHRRAVDGRRRRGRRARAPGDGARRTHPLASVRDSFNAVFVEGAAVGSLMFYGRGAGGGPTASAVLGDVIDAAVNLRKGTHGSLGTFGQGPHPPDRRDVGRVPPQPRGRRPARRAARRHRRVRRATASASAPPSRRASAPRPGWCSSPTRRASPPCRRPCASCASSTSVRSVGGLLRVIGG